MIGVGLDEAYGSVAAAYEFTLRELNEQANSQDQVDSLVEWHSPAAWLEVLLGLAAGDDVTDDVLAVAMLAAEAHPGPDGFVARAMAAWPALAWRVLLSEPAEHLADPETRASIHRAMGRSVPRRAVWRWLRTRWIADLRTARWIAGPMIRHGAPRPQRSEP